VAYRLQSVQDHRRTSEGRKMRAGIPKGANPKPWYGDAKGVRLGSLA